jgi:hypothetical protein
MQTRAAVVMLVLYSISAFAQVDCVGEGRIEGRVVDSDRRPVADAEVTVLSEQCVVTGFNKPEAKSNTEGSFVLSHVPLGLNGVHAQKPESGYPDTTAAIYDDDSAPTPKVVIRSGEVVSGVIVKLGKKAGTVTGQIVDADNSQPVVAARIRISKPDNDRIMMSMGPDLSGRFHLLLPPRPVTLTVKAAGYEPWQFTGPDQVAPGVIQLKSEETTELTVRLQKSRQDPK